MAVISRRIKPISWNVQKGLVATEWDWWWKYDHRFLWPGFERSGTSIKNLVSQKDIGTIQNGPVPWLDTQYGRALDFQGGTDRAEFADAANLSVTGAITVAAFFRVDSGNVDNSGLVAKYRHESGETVQRAYNLFCSPALAAGFVISDDGAFKAGGNLLSADNTLIAGAYHFQVGRFIPSTSQDVFVDGVNVASDTTSILAGIADTVAPLWLGHQFNSTQTDQGLDGPILLASVIADALTDEEIRVWSRDPFGPLYMAPRRIGFVPAAGGGFFTRRYYDDLLAGAA